MLQAFCKETHEKVFSSYGGQHLSAFQHVYIPLNILKLVYFTQIYIGMLPIKHGINNTNILCTGLHKTFSDPIGGNF